MPFIQWTLVSITYILITVTIASVLRVGDTAFFGIDPIPGNYGASIADTDTENS